MGSVSAAGRVLVSLIFTCLTFFAGIDFFVMPVLAATPAERYESAKKELEKLQSEKSQRASQRAPWQKLAAELLSVYEQGGTWNNRVAALYRSAMALEEIAWRSRVRKDAQNALTRYEQMISSHPTSVLADDALFHSARIRAELLADPNGARKNLERICSDYTQSDMKTKAEEYLTKLGLAPQKAPPKKKYDLQQSQNDGSKNTQKKVIQIQRTKVLPALLRQVSWQTKPDQVTITLDVNRPVVWTIKSMPANPKTGSPIRLIVDLVETGPDNRIRPGVKIKDSMLSRMRLDLSTPGHTRIYLDFSDMKIFTANTTKQPFRIKIVAARQGINLPGAVALGHFVQSEEPIKPATASLPANLARQLGLRVNTVIVDAGHGGKDPGTSHNGIVEREITLDLAKRVGAILASRGVKVYYTRESNIFVSLDDRTRKAKALKADLFVSIHINANNNPQKAGLETYYLNFASSSDAAKLAAVENAVSDRPLGEMEGLVAELMLGARAQESRTLARSIQDTSLARLRKKGYNPQNGGIKSAPFYVLLRSGMPGALIEVGYCSNEEEAKLLADREYRASLADGIAAGVLAYTNKLGY